MDDRQALAHEIQQAALAECVAPRQDHCENDLAMVQGAPAPDHIAHVRNMVPQGWQLVPIKPTPEMMLHKSGCQHHAHDDMTCAARRTRELVWGHMLAAAPKPDHLPDATKMVANSFTDEDLEGMANGDNLIKARAMSNLEGEQ